MPLVLFVLLALLWTPGYLFADPLDGESVYRQRCAACHGFEGEGRKGLGPELRDQSIGDGSLAALLDVTLNGRSGTLMVAFRKNMSAQELAAVSNYLMAGVLAAPTAQTVTATDVGRF